MTGQLLNQRTMTEVLFGNQLVEQPTGGAIDEILYYGSLGQQTSSDKLTFDGTTLALTGDLIVNGDIQHETPGETVTIAGSFQVDGTTNVAIGPNPFSTASPGPALVYRNNTMPIYWTTSFVVLNRLGSGTFLGSTGGGGVPSSPQWIIRNATPFFLVTNGPYISSPLTATVTAMNGNLSANQSFFPGGGMIANSTGNTIATGGRIERIAAAGWGTNVNVAQLNIGVLFLPVITA